MLNKGFQRANGEVLGWLNSDDLYLPGAIEKAMMFLEANPSVAMVYGDAEYIDESGVVLDDYVCPDFDLRELAAHCYICQPAIFLHRRALEAAGWVDPRLHYTMDCDSWIRLGLRYPIQHRPAKLAQYRVHGAAKTSTGREQMSREGRRMARKHFGQAPQTWCEGVAQFLALNLTSLRGVRHIREHLAGTILGRWPDGWVSRRLRLAVPLQSGDRVLALYGRHLMPGRPLELDLYCNDVLWDQIMIRQLGDFMAPIELPELLANNPVPVTIESRRIYRLPRELRGFLSCWMMC